MKASSGREDLKRGTAGIRWVLAAIDGRAYLCLLSPVLFSGQLWVLRLSATVKDILAMRLSAKR